jgi:hypothetical protein
MTSSHASPPARFDDLGPVDPRHPDAAFIQRELDRDRKHEWVLVPKAIIALAVVAVLVVIRQLFFV